MAAEIKSESGFARLVAGIRQEHWLSLTLLALHGALLLELGDPLAKALLLSHFGSFLMWQRYGAANAASSPARPYWSVRRPADHRRQLVADGGMAGSAVRADRRQCARQHEYGQRVTAMLAAGYLLAILLTWVVPHLFAEQSFPDHPDAPWCDTGAGVA